MAGNGRKPTGNQGVALSQPAVAEPPVRIIFTLEGEEITLTDDEERKEEKEERKVSGALDFLLCDGGSRVECRASAYLALVHIFLLARAWCA